MYLFNGIPKLCTQASLTAFFCCRSIGGTNGPVGKWSRSCAMTYQIGEVVSLTQTAFQSGDNPMITIVFGHTHTVNFQAPARGTQPLRSWLPGASPGSCVLVFVLQHNWSGGCRSADVDLQTSAMIAGYRNQRTSQAALIQTSGHPGSIYWFLTWAAYKTTNATLEYHWLCKSVHCAMKSFPQSILKNVLEKAKKSTTKQKKKKRL